MRSGKMIQRGDIYWVDFGVPVSHAPAKMRPFLILQIDEINGTAIGTTTGAPFTTNQNAAKYPGGVFIPKEVSGLPKDSVVKRTELMTVDKFELQEYIGTLTEEYMIKVMDEFKRVFGVA
jgi:mRNA interferase MazF